jgi:hypothetical protein
MNETESRRGARRLVAAVAAAWLATAPGRAATLVANPDAGSSDPDFYRTLIGQLQPGDTLLLPAGTYRERLPLSDVQGQPDAWITISGPSSGPPAIVTTDSDCCNNVQLGNTWYVAIKNLTLDSNSDGVDASIDGINAKSGATHDILIENCTLTGLSFHQSTVGISTKSSAWNWTIRRNTILEAGTGMYLGNSTGSSPFIAGVIEGNLIVDTIGYNIEIKFQNPYSLAAGMPAGPQRTVIRNNVFLRRRSQASWPPMDDGSSRLSGPRPSLLVGGFPASGPGTDDLYEIYGNFFFQNPDEALLQASGRVAIHDNVLVGASDTAIRLANHDLPLKLAHVYNNTIYGGARGIRFSSSASQDDAVVGNLVFAGSPISGSYRAENLQGNLVDDTASAGSYVQNPSLVLGQMDFYPRPGQAQGAPLDLSRFAGQTDHALDFNGVSKGGFTFRGAYAGAGTNPGWALDAAHKVGGPSGAPGGDPDVPDAPAELELY